MRLRSQRRAVEKARSRRDHVVSWVARRNLDCAARDRCGLVMKPGMDLPKPHRDIARFVQGGALLLTLAIALAACGGGTATSVPAPGTPSGTSVVTVTATVSVAGQTTVTRTIPITVTIE